MTQARTLRAAVVGACAAALIAGTTPPVGAAASIAGSPTAVSGYARATVGILSAATSVLPATAVRAGAPGASRVRTHRSTNAAARVQTAAPSVAAAGAAGESRVLSRNFDGVGSLDSAVTNFGAEFEPPDQGLCVGNGFVVEPVNSAYRVYRRDGTTVAGPLNVNVLFSEGLAEFTSDPRCYFDKSTNTWFASILFISADNTASHLDLAVNPSGDPTTPWTVYRIDTTATGLPGHAGCPCFGDQPLLGIDGFNVYVSTNEFSILGPEFNGAQIYAVAKSDLVTLRAAHFVHFENLSIGGALATSIQPSITNGRAAAEFFLNSLDPSGTGDNRLGVWAITDRAAVAHGGIPTLSSVVIGSEAYSIPPRSAQKGAASTLDSDDDRMQQVQFIDGVMWGALGTAVTTPRDPSAHAGVAWFTVRPRLHREVIVGAKLVHQGYLAARGGDFIYPSIQADEAGNVVIGGTLTGVGRFPSAAFAVLHRDRDAFGAPIVAAAGTGPYDPTATRWGDYSAAVLDPAGGGFWLAVEYMPPTSSQTTDGRRDWGTRVLRVAADE